MGIFALEGSSMGAGAAWSRHPLWAGARAVLVPAPVRALNSSHSSVSGTNHNACPLPIQVLCWIKAGSVLHNCVLSSAISDFVLVESFIRARGVGVGVQRGPGVSAVPAGGNQPECQAVSIFFLCLVLRPNKPVLALCEWCLGFSQPHC